MQDLSMHIMDIVENSVRANALNIEIHIEENLTNNLFKLTIIDDGFGMDEKFVSEIKNPFKTTRTTRRVGLGIPLLHQTAVMAAGDIFIESTKSVGTKILVLMEHNNIDRPPLGDIASSIFLILISHENIDFIFTYKVDNNIYELNTKDIKQILNGVSFQEPKVSAWIKENLSSEIRKLKT